MFVSTEEQVTSQSEGTEFKSCDCDIGRLQGGSVNFSTSFALLWHSQCPQFKSHTHTSPMRDALPRYASCTKPQLFLVLLAGCLPLLTCIPCYHASSWLLDLKLPPCNDLLAGRTRNSLSCSGSADAQGTGVARPFRIARTVGWFPSGLYLCLNLLGLFNNFCTCHWLNFVYLHLQRSVLLYERAVAYTAA